MTNQKADYEYILKAEKELGVSKLDRATGAILGIVIAIITVVISVGLDDFENTAFGWKLFLWIISCGAIGAYIGEKKWYAHQLKINDRAKQLQQMQKKT